MRHRPRRPPRAPFHPAPCERNCLRTGRPSTPPRFLFAWLSLTRAWVPAPLALGSSTNDDTSSGEFVDLYFLGWPPSRADIEPDEDTSWWRPTMLRKGYWLRHICEQYHFAAVAIDSILQAKPWIDSLATADIPPAVSLYRHEFAAIDARLGEVNVMECYCPPICFTTVRDRLAWSRIPARLRPRRFNAPHAQVHSLDACCGLLRDPIDTSYVLQPWESDEDDDDSDDEEVAYLFAEENCPAIRCLAPRGRAASDAAAPQSGWR